MPDVHGAGGLGALCAKPPRCVPACRHYSASSSDGSAGAGASDSEHSAASAPSGSAVGGAGDGGGGSATGPGAGAAAVTGAGDDDLRDAEDGVHGAHMGSVREAFAAGDPDAQTNEKLFPTFDGVASWQPDEPRKYRELLTDEDFDKAGASEDVRRAFDLHNATQMERNRDRVDRAILRFRMHDNDTGSAPVQAAVLTERIHYMVAHLQKHRKDKHSRRGLQGMLNKRRKLLKYLRRKDFDVYKTTITELKLRDNYY